MTLITTTAAMKALATSDPALATATAKLNELSFVGEIAGKSILARYVNEADIVNPPAPAWYLPATRTAYIHVERAGLTTAPHTDPYLPKPTREAATVLGLLAHESGHAAISDDMDLVTKAAPHHGALLTLLEELRVENHALRRQPFVRKFLRASFGLILANLPDEFENKGHVVRAWAMTRGRTLSGVADTRETDAVDIAARTLLGDDIVDALTDLLQEALTLNLTFHGDRQRMIDICDEWVDLVGEPPEDEGGCTGHGDESGEGLGTSDPSEKGDTSDGDATGGSEGSVDADGPPSDTPLEEGTTSGWGTPGHDPDADDEREGDDGLDDEAAELMAALTRDLTALMADEWQKDPEVERRSPAGVWAQQVFGDRRKSARLEYKQPTAAARKHVVDVANALSNLMLPTIAKTAKASAVPPGRMRSREALRASAERAGGRMVTAQPWKSTVRRHTTARPLVIGVATDTSGSMRWAESGVAEFAYVWANAGHRIGARTAAVTFGDSVHRIARPGEVLDSVTWKSASDGSEKCDHALAALDGVLHLTTPGLAARILLVVSDGALVDRGEPGKALAWMKAMTEAGTHVIWISDQAEDTSGPYQSWLRKAIKLPGFTLTDIVASRSAGGSVFDMLNSTALDAVAKYVR